MVQNPLVAGGYYSMRDVYGNKFGVSTLEQTAVEPEEHAALANTDETAPSPKTENHVGILTWLGIIVLFVILFQWGGQ